MIRRPQVYTVPLLLVSLTGCTLWPSGWRIGGTPNQREQKAAQRVATARTDLDTAAQRAVHQTGEALGALNAQLAATDSASDPKLQTLNAKLQTAASTAADFNTEAQTLLDQAHGAPTAADTAAWHQTVADTLAGDPRSRSAQSAEIATLSTKLRQLEDAHTRALEAVKREAAENTYWADLAHKALWIALAFGLFVVATHLFGLAAHLNPGSALLGTMATGLHSLLASGAVLAERSAQEGLQRVGAGLALVRQKLPAVAAEVTDYLDATTASHPTAQQHIASGATKAAGSE